ncbi:MAG: hypothetical protein GEU75_09675 [Dehalococcoidia bacterium]|nr:hypothetical protein [Dehalococcoidia bacterium]
MKRVPVESTADAYLEILAARGIDYLFGNGGTDFGPIIEAYAKRTALEQPVPAPMTVPHEITAHSEELYERLPIVAAENVLRGLRGEEPVHVRNPEVLPRWRQRLADLGVSGVVS